MENAEGRGCDDQESQPSDAQGRATYFSDYKTELSFSQGLITAGLSNQKGRLLAQDQRAGQRVPWRWAEGAWVT